MNHFFPDSNAVVKRYESEHRFPKALVVTGIDQESNDVQR